MSQTAMTRLYRQTHVSLTNCRAALLFFHKRADLRTWLFSQISFLRKARTVKQTRVYQSTNRDFRWIPENFHSVLMSQSWVVLVPTFQKHIKFNFGSALAFLRNHRFNDSILLHLFLLKPKSRPWCRVSLLISLFNAIMPVISRRQSRSDVWRMARLGNVIKTSVLDAHAESYVNYAVAGKTGKQLIYDRPWSSAADIWKFYA